MVITKTAHGLTAASSTISRPILRLDVRVLRGEFVVSLAMRLIGTTRDSGPADAVISMRYGLKVRGIYTGRSAAQMIEFHPFRDRPDKKFVGDSMSP